MVPLLTYLCAITCSPSADTPSIVDMSLKTDSRMIDINARAYTGLIHQFGREMRARLVRIGIALQANIEGVAIRPGGCWFTVAPHYRPCMTGGNKQPTHRRATQHTPPIHNYRVH